MRQFNLEEYLKNPNRRVVTRNGLAVRIICTDRKDKWPIVALVTDDDAERIYPYLSNGAIYPDDSSRLDLMFAPIKHEGWINVFRDGSGSGYKYAVIFNSKQEARNDVVENERCGYITTTKIEWEE